MAENNVGFDYQGVEAIKQQVVNVNEDVQNLFTRIDRAIAENMGEGTTFYGQKANEFLKAWDEAKACFPKYTAKITAICDSAQAAGGIYAENENTGNVVQL